MHLSARVVQRCCQGHADGLLFVPEHRTQPQLSPSLSDTTNRWSPAGLLHSWSHKRKQMTMLMMMIDTAKIRGPTMLRRGSRTASSAKRKTHICTEVAATQVAESWTKTQRLKDCTSLLSMAAVKVSFIMATTPGWIRTRDGHMGKTNEAHARLAEGTSFSNRIYLHVQSASPQKTSRDA